MVKAYCFILLTSVIIFSSCGDNALEKQMTNGKKVYELYCQTCHMDNGGGVPNMNASLIGSPVVNGDEDKLIRIVLHGSAELEKDPGRKSYQNKMPSFAMLSDTAIADVCTFVRNSFDNKASAIQPLEVKSRKESGK